MKKEEETASIIEWYNNLEKRLRDFFEYIPLRHKNRRVTSPKLVSIAVEACTVLDSIFRHFSFKYRKSSGVKGKKKNLGINDYAKIYSERLHLATRKTLVLAPEESYIIPFSSWAIIVSGHDPVPPEWWTIYNKVKHGRIENGLRCTVWITVSALAGLHQVICQLPELRQAIITYGWLAPTYLNPEATEQEIQRGLPFAAVTDLFATTVGKETFPDDITKLSPSHYQGHAKLQRFLGRE